MRGSFELSWKAEVVWHIWKARIWLDHTGSWGFPQTQVHLYALYVTVGWATFIADFIQLSSIIVPPDGCHRKSGDKVF